MMSAMFYALYSLSKLIDRFADVWRRAACVYVNGKEVWDGGGQQQTGLSLQWRSTENTEITPIEPSALADDLQMDARRSDSLRYTEDMFPREAGGSAAGLSVCADVEVERDADVGFGGDPTHGAFGRPVFDLAALLADAPQDPDAAEPVGWHFPVGPGLSQMCHCPYVQFPDVSYYPAFKDSDNIEVMWRVWEDLSETHSDASVDASAVFDFTLMSYNLLAQDLLEANPHLYTHCPEEVLLWENRLQGILKELQFWRPDIVCLQEAQEDHFLQQIQPVLTSMGYTCIYKRRTGSKTDGCAVCFLHERFTQRSVCLLELRQPHCPLLDRDNVAIVLLLQPAAGLRPVCVANTHLLFNPRRGDVKLAQLAVLLAEVDHVVETCRSEGTDCEVILCGDFNALPSSPLWTFITSGQLYYNGLPTWMVSCQTDLSYKFHHTRLFAPLWPSSLGISDRCRYESDTQTEDSVGKRRYSHEFLRQLRFCAAACVRPADLELIPGVTDKTPDPKDTEMFSPRFGHTLRHELRLRCAYGPVRSEALMAPVSSLNAEGAAMVDFIFYSPHRSLTDGDEERVCGLQLLGRLSLLSEADLWAVRGLPSEHFPSDHLSLLVKLRLS